jgi:hypothetical protein
MTRRWLVALMVLGGALVGCAVASTAPGSGQTPGVASRGDTAPVASLGASGRDQRSAIVAWVDRPAPEYVELTPRPLPTDARPCRPSDLKTTAGGVDGAMSNTNLPVSFTNIADSACLLAGAPTVDGIRTNGTTVPLHPTEGSYFGDPGPPANIAPGGIAALNISGGVACDEAQAGRQRIYPKLRIGLPAGGAVDIASGGFDTICGVSVSSFGVPADIALVPEPSPSPLVARLTSPTSVTPGTTLVYTVTLSNPSAEAVSLLPCPAYDEFVGSGSTGPWVATVLHYYLNCDTASTILAHGAVTFEMRLAVPLDQPPGTAKFGWDIQGGSGPGAASPLDVKTSP